MSDETPAPSVEVLYLEPDDEITSVVRRLGEVRASAAILVAPGRGKATASAIGLRLLARRAEGLGISLRLVADASSRLLAAEAGIAAYGSLAEAQAGDGAAPAELPQRPRAAIHVVRGERTGLTAASSPPAAARSTPAHEQGSPASIARAPHTGRIDDTQAVPVVTPPSPQRERRRRPRLNLPQGRRAWAWVAGSVVVLAALVAAILPGATVTIVPRTRLVGPLSYTLELASAVETGTLTSTKSAAATGTHVDATPATGSVTFANYDATVHTVPKGTSVSAGSLHFTTDAAVRLPPGTFTIGGIAPGTASVAVTAAEPGPDSNVPAGAIDTVDDPGVANQLGGPFRFRSTLVRNQQPTTGGTSTTKPEVSAEDVDGLVATIKDDLAAQLARKLAGSGRLYAPPPSAEEPEITIPGDLVGSTGSETFELTGTLRYSRRFCSADQLRTALAAAMQDDPRAQPAGTSLVASSITYETGELALSGETIKATVAARAAVVPLTDESELKAKIAGRSRADAVDALADVGAATIDLWPGWVDAVPRLPFRIGITIQAPAPAPTPSTSPGVAAVAPAP